MSTIIREIGYTGFLQRLILPEGFSADVTVHAWGGGGGGGGANVVASTSGGGGNGGGGGYIAKTLTVGPSDVLEIAVGGGGGGGVLFDQGTPGGSGGESLKLPTYQYIVSGSVPLVFDILTIGGGGGGGGGSSRQFLWSGAGGGAGDIRYSSVIFNPGDRIAIDVGRGGAAGLVRDGLFTPGAPGTAGTASQVRRDASTVLKANGGGGGQQAQNTRPVPGAGGSNSGNYTQPLRPQSGTSVYNGASGFGGVGGIGANGYLISGPDAAGPYFYGSAGVGGVGNTNTPGQTGTVYGGGGGGGGQNSANNLAGFFSATGGSGVVIVSYNTTDGVPVLAGGDITIRGLRVTHVFLAGTESAYNGGTGGAAVTDEGAGGGGGGGATVILLNGIIVGYAGGGGGGSGGASAVPIAYTGSTASNPWGTGIVAGTSGYYVRNVGVSGGSNYIIGYAVVVDGVTIYQADVPTAGNPIEPPDPAQIAKTTLVGYSYFVTIPQPNNNPWGLPTDQDLYELVECFNFVVYQDFQSQNAPGPNGQSIAATEGSNGESGFVGGGGGGGAGGNGGGAGDPQGSGAQAGAFGRLIGNVTETPNATQPGGINTPYYPGTVGVGGGAVDYGAGQPGTSGYAVVVMQTKSFQIKDSGTWKPVNHAFIKHNNAWQEIQAIWVKQNGLWYPVIGGGGQYDPYFAARIGYFGSIPRPYGT